MMLTLTGLADLHPNPKRPKETGPGIRQARRLNTEPQSWLHSAGETLRRLRRRLTQSRADFRHAFSTSELRP